MLLFCVLSFFSLFLYIMLRKEMHCSVVNWIWCSCLVLYCNVIWRSNCFFLHSAAPTGKPAFKIDTGIFGERSVHFQCSGDPGYPHGHLEFWVKFVNGTDYEEFRFHSAVRTVTDKNCQREETVQVDYLFPMRWNGAKIRCQAPDSDLYTEHEIWLISGMH